MMMLNNTGQNVSVSIVVVSAGSFLLCLLLRQLSWYAWRREEKGGGRHAASLASPCLPLLGNAMFYKADPVGFLEAQRARLGSCFRLDMAGLRMTVVSSPHEMLQVAGAKESILSAQAATADFGFAETLGPFNVYFGTDLHRFVLKGPSFMSSLGLRSTDGSDAPGGLLQSAITDAVSAELPGRARRIRDAMTSLRRITLHAVVLHLIGEPVLAAYNIGGRDFLGEFMQFQDRVEDATAKGVTLPAAVAGVLIWRPVRHERGRIVRALGTAISSVQTSGDSVGLWLEAVRSIKDRSSIPAWRRYLQHCHSSAQDAPITAEETAELIVGLLFAAHKNPAIGAAQTLLLLLEHPCELKKVLAELRGGGGVALGSSASLRRSILETLRITAHTIGGIRKVMEREGFDLSTADGKQINVAHGEYIVLSHTLPNRDPTRFPSPCAFVPDRFLAMDESDEYVFTTFSQGLHRCPGRSYAIQLMEKVLEEMLRRFDFSFAGPVFPMSHARATLAQRSGPCQLEYQGHSPCDTGVQAL